MTATASQMLSLGRKMPSFCLYNTVSNESFDSASLDPSAITVVMFICNHCPYVVHIRDKIVEVARTYQAQGVHFIAISSNDIKAYPDDGPKHMAKLAHSLQMPFPYLFDEDQSIAKSFAAACTPDFFIYQAQKLVYRGQFDNSRPGNHHLVTGNDLSAALDAALLQKEPLSRQLPSIGCNIKWRPGREPEYTS